MALYGDLGDDARDVGPWLWVGATLASATLLPIAQHHGASELQWTGSVDRLVTHLAALRYIHTHDDQRYFLRYADMRAVTALRSALDEVQWAGFIGPVNCWRCIDRHGKEQAVATEAVPTSHASEGLRLSAEQLAALLDAGLPDQLCAALEELEEPGLNPASDARQFDRLETAVQWMRQHDIETFELQRAVARQVVLHGPEVVEAPMFDAVMRAALASGKADPVNAWTPGMRRGPVR